MRCFDSPFSSTRLHSPCLLSSLPGPTSSAPASVPCPHHNACQPPAGNDFNEASWCIRCNVSPGACGALTAFPSLPWNMVPVAAILAAVDTDRSAVREDALRQKPLTEPEGTPTEASVLLLSTFSLQQLIKRCWAI